MNFIHVTHLSRILRNLTLWNVKLKLYALFLKKMNSILGTVKNTKHVIFL